MFSKRYGQRVILSLLSLMMLSLLSACSDSNATGITLATATPASPITTGATNTATAIAVPTVVQSNPTPTANPPTATALPTTQVSTPTQQPTAPTATPTSLPTTQTVPTASPTTASQTPPVHNAGQVLQTDKAVFLDDRTNALTLLSSYYNAINRKEYVRAYSYWEAQSGANGQPEPYAQTVQGFAATAVVQLTVGNVFGGAAAGSIYYQVPVVVNSTLTTGGKQTFAGCYTLRAISFGLITQPPFQPLAIQSATIQPVTAAPADLLSNGCEPGGGVANIPPSSAATSDSAAEPATYLDSRNTAQDVLRSYYNAINSKDYVRAYYYWDHVGTAATAQPPVFDQFVEGYQTTKSVKLTTSQPVSSPTAGGLIYKVPVTLVASSTDGSTQTFVGCYLVKQFTPNSFTAPPFAPMGISSVSLQEVPNEANTATLMGQALPLRKLCKKLRGFIISHKNIILIQNQAINNK